jgi:hypothetical protein
MPVKIEIEVPRGLSASDIFELRNCLRKNVQGIEINLKEKPIKEGEMGVDLREGIIAGFVHVAAEMALEELVRAVWEPHLKPAINGWWSSVHTGGSIEQGQLEKMNISIVPADNSKNVITLNLTNGEQHIFENLYYSLDIQNTQAIIIGNSTYASGNFPDIPPAVGNAEDIAALFANKACIGLAEENVTVSLNKTSDDIQELLYSISRKPGIETLIIYYTGHGYQADTQKYFLTASNTRKINNVLIGGIDFDFIRNEIIRLSPAKQKIIILDACQSGLAAQSGTSAQPLEVKGSYVLASSSADESSYFSRDNRNTYFTSALLQVLKSGVANEFEMLSLEDIYEETGKILKDKKLSLPYFKNELNIPPANFYMTVNPGFSIKNIISNIEQLFKKGEKDEALNRCNKTLKRHPGNIELLQLAQHIRTDIHFTKLVREGDILLYGQKKRAAAAAKYKEALMEKDDFGVRMKLKECGETIIPTKPSKELKPAEPKPPLRPFRVKKLAIALITSVLLIAVSYTWKSLTGEKADAKKAPGIAAPVNAEPVKENKPATLPSEQIEIENLFNKLSGTTNSDLKSQVIHSIISLCENENTEAVELGKSGTQVQHLKIADYLETLSVTQSKVTIDSIQKNKNNKISKLFYHEN